MAKDKIHLPSGGAGITRYFEEYKSKITLKPGTVIVLIIVVVTLVLLLEIYGNTLLGIQ